MSDNPREYDVVLGGQSPAPINAAVLGGIKGVKLRLSSQLIEHRKSALSEALNYGEEGLKLVLKALDDSEEEFHKYAYNLLKSKGELDVKAALEKYVQQSYFIRFDGLYCANTQANSNTWSFFRFYQDGTVLAARVLSSEQNLPERVAQWLNHDGNHLSRGTYKIEDNRLNFSVTYMDDTTDYWGEIEMYGNAISLNIYKHNRYYKYLKTYYFAHVPNIN